MRTPRLPFLILLVAGCGDDSSSTMPDMAADMTPAHATLAMPCTDAIADVYTTPTSLPAFDASHRGDVVRCAFERTLTATEVDATLVTIGYTGPMQPSGADVFRILYRTERAPKADGSTQSGVSSARVFVPTTRVAPDGLVVVAHGTAGEADKCAPSRRSLDFSAGQQDDTFVMQLGLAGAGFAVIATDYAGLGAGDPPAQGWSSSSDEAQSTLDATRAMAKLLPTAPAKVVVVGHSQGGHVVLSTQALAKSYGLAGTLVGTVAFAPLWIPPGSWGAAISQAGAAGFNLSTTKTAGIISFSMYYFFGHGEVIDGPGGGLSMFQASKRDAVKQLLTTGCLDDVEAGLPALGMVPEDFYDPTFAEAVGNCDLTGACTDDASKLWWPRFVADRPPVDTEAGPILIWQGGMDTTVAPKFAQCGFDKINADLKADAAASTKLTLCGDPADDHGSVVRHHTGDVIAWVGARLGVASEPPACTAYTGPACGLPANDRQ